MFLFGFSMLNFVFGGNMYSYNYDEMFWICYWCPLAKVNMREGISEDLAKRLVY